MWIRHGRTAHKGVAHFQTILGVAHSKVLNSKACTRRTPRYFSSTIFFDLV